MKVSRAQSISLIVGSCLIGSWIAEQLTSTGLSSRDISPAFAPVARLPIKAHGTFTATVATQSDPALERVFRAWGNPGYVVALENDRGHLACTNALKLELVTATGQNVPLMPTKRAIYGYSADCSEFGYVFRLKAGSGFTLTGSVDSSAVGGASYVIVARNWIPETKDLIVGVAIREALHPLFAWCAVWGAVISIAGMCSINSSLSRVFAR